MLIIYLRLLKISFWSLLLGLAIYPFVHILHIHLLASLHHQAVRENTAVLHGEKIELELTQEEYRKAFVEDEEIIWKNRRYDVVEMFTLQDGRVQLIMIHDSYEESLLHSIIDFHRPDRRDDHSTLKISIPDWIIYLFDGNCVMGSLLFNSIFNHMQLTNLPSYGFAWGPPPDIYSTSW